MLILVARDRLITIFLGWEGLGISSFLLIVFYHNWMRAKGGLLTLLTNRLGDALLLITMAYWMFKASCGLFVERGLVLLTGLALVSFTKSAQWPFAR